MSDKYSSTARQLRLLKKNNVGYKIGKISETHEDKGGCSLNAGFRFHLLAKAVPPTHMKPYLMQSTARRALNLSEDDFQLLPLAEDTYDMCFLNAKDRERAWREQPLIVFASLILMSRWDGISDYRNVDVDEFECWVQLDVENHESLTADIARDLFWEVGRFAAVPRNFMFQPGLERAKMIIKSSHPLKTLVAKETPGGEQFFAMFRYERLRILCYICGLVTHECHFCPKRTGFEFTEKTFYALNEQDDFWGPFVLIDEWDPNTPRINHRRMYELYCSEFDQEGEASAGVM